MNKLYLLIVLSLFALPTQAQIDSVFITFEVNMSEVTVDSTGVFLAGGPEFDVVGNFPMLDPDNDSIFSITVHRPEGFTSFYTFLNGECIDYMCKEDIVGQYCAIDTHFYDRYLPPVYSDTTLSTCFAKCTPDATCPEPADVTFRVDMSQETVDNTGVFIGLDADNWSGTQQLSPVGNDIYEVTVPLLYGDHQYKFINGANWAFGENLDGVEDAACTKTTLGFTNRTLAIQYQDSTLETVCFASCYACGFVASIENDLFEQGLIQLYPNPADQQLYIQLATALSHTAQIKLSDLSGRLMLDQPMMAGTTQQQLDIAHLAPGMYILQFHSDDQSGRQKLLIRH